MKRLLSIFVVWLSAFAVHAAEKLEVLSFLREADQISIFSLYPQEIYETDEHGNPTEAEKKKEHLHRYLVMGKIAVTEAQTRELVRQSLVASLTNVREAATLLCFDPRHAVCLRKGEQHVDLLICFECDKGRVYYFDEFSLRTYYVGIGPDGRDALNALLDSRQIPRDIPRKHKEPSQTPKPTTAGEAKR